MRLAAALLVLATLHPFAGYAESGEATPGKPLSISLDGPASVPVSLEMKSGSNSAAKLFLEVWMDGKGIKRVSVPGGIGTTTLAVPAGHHLFEFRADPASKVALLNWTPSKLLAGPGASRDSSEPSMLAASPVVAQAAAASATAKARNGELLARPYTPATGEVVAQDLFQVLVGMRPIDSFTTVSYDKNTRTIVLAIFGNDTSVDGAKRVIEDLRAKTVEPLSYRAELMWGLHLEDSDFTIRYLNRAQDFREVVRREAGHYVIGD